MRIREPKALLVMVIFLWTYVLCQGMHHLILNLENKEDEIWEDFNNDRYYLCKIGVICYLGGMTAFFYRGWMFWFKSGAGREATAYFFAIQKFADDEPSTSDESQLYNTLCRRPTICPVDRDKSNQFFSNRRHQLANPKIVGGVLGCFLLVTFTLHIVLQGEDAEKD